jgi:hypothetical protein
MKGMGKQRKKTNFLRPLADLLYFSRSGAVAGDNVPLGKANVVTQSIAGAWLMAFLLGRKRRLPGGWQVENERQVRLTQF